MSAGLLKSFAVKLEKKQNNLFTYPIDKQKKYIAHFPEPKDGFERGYFQYCCQMKLYGEPTHAALNLSAFPLSFLYLLKIKKKVEIPQGSADAVFFNEGKPHQIIPQTVLDEYENIVTVSSEEHLLSREDRKFLRRIYRKYPFSWMLWLKLILKLSQYSHAITKYAPRAIISCSEFSFTSPIIMEYCYSRGVELINVMHGEKLYFMRDSFAKYDRYYVWDDGYVKLLTSLRADREQFRVEVPPAVLVRSDETVEKKYDYTYYLQNESDEELGLLAARLRTLAEGGAKLSVRPHPRYTNMALATRLFDGINLERCKDISIETSILQTENVISKYSSVLNQAYHSGVNIVIDDISEPEKFAKLKELQFVMLEVEHKLLSEIVG